MQRGAYQSLVQETKSINTEQKQKEIEITKEKHGGYIQRFTIQLNGLQKGGGGNKLQVFKTIQKKI